MYELLETCSTMSARLIHPKVRFSQDRVTQTPAFLFMAQALTDSFSTHSQAQLMECRASQPSGKKQQADNWTLSPLDLQAIFAECEQRGFRCRHFRRFVETGTFLGQTVVGLASHFEELHTIEVDSCCYEAAKLAAWKAARPVHFHLGHSAHILEKILPSLGPAVFYLDAHYSGSVTGGVFSEVPLLEELIVLNKYFQHAGLVVIDDMDLFNKMNSFEMVSGKSGKSCGSRTSDWRSINCESISKCFTADRVQCSFPTASGDRFILCLRAAPGGMDCESSQTSVCGTTYGAVCLDLTWRMSDRGASHWLSVPGHPLDMEGIKRLRSHGAWWCRIADAMERELEAESESKHSQYHSYHSCYCYCQKYCHHYYHYGYH